MCRYRPGDGASTKNQATPPVKVTPETFIRAETDARFAGTIQRAGGVNRPSYFRVPTPLDAQIVMRMNRDTIYTPTVVDTSKGATITVPENLPKDRLITILVLDNDKLSAQSHAPQDRPSRATETS